MTYSSAILARAGLTNPHVHEFVAEWARILTPDRIEVVDADADERLLTEALEAGEIVEAGRDRYLAHSHPGDTARSEERTVVATHDPAHRGVYNNWRDADEVRAQQIERMSGAMAGRTMYVVPYLMAPPGSPLARWAVGVQLSDNRVVVLQMLRMARVGTGYLNDLDDPGFFVRAVHATGDLDSGHDIGFGDLDDTDRDIAIINEEAITGSAVARQALEGRADEFLRSGNRASRDGEGVPHLKSLWPLLESFEADLRSLKVDEDGYRPTGGGSSFTDFLDDYFMLFRLAVRTVNAGDVHAGVDERLNLF